MASTQPETSMQVAVSESQDPVRNTLTWELQQLQHREGFLSNQSLIQLAQRLGCHLVELEEVVSFFPHFRRQPPPVCEIHVCRDLACFHKGSAELIARLRQDFPDGEKAEVKVCPVSCLGRCDRAPAAFIEIPSGHGVVVVPENSSDRAGTPATEEPRHEHVFGFHAATAEEIRTAAERLKAAVRAQSQSNGSGVADGGLHLSFKTDTAFVPRHFNEWKIEPYLPAKMKGDAGQKPAASPVLAAVETSANPEVEALPPPVVAYGALEKLQQINAASNGDFEAAKREFGLLENMKTANLRGMGGAGIVAAGKWGDVAKQASAEKYVVCNADESEPLTFKDREILLRMPHLVIEGMILAGLHCGAERGYIYVRHEYQEQIAALRKAIAFARDVRKVCGQNVAGTGRNFFLDVFVSPGGYICGEQSALIEAMEGHRAQPRGKPPGLETNGLFDKPTLVSNVETFAWVPAVALGAEAPREKGRLAARSGTGSASNSASRADGAVPPPTERSDAANWYAGLGERGFQGRRLFSICGDLKFPGVYEMRIGATLGELVSAAGGIVGADRGIVVLATSGPSGGFLPARITDPDLIQCFEVVTAGERKKMQKSIGRDQDAIAKKEAELKSIVDAGVSPESEAKSLALRGEINKLQKSRQANEESLALHEAVWNKLRSEGESPRAIDLLQTPLDIDWFRAKLDMYFDASEAEDLQKDIQWRQPVFAKLPPGILLGAGLGVFVVEPRKVLQLAINATEFYGRETCGKCVPCRLGTGRFLELLRKLERPETVDIRELVSVVSCLDETLRETSICGLGTSVPAPLLSTLKFFWNCIPGLQTA
ncbi:MAG: NAD(P)H-dependent oxidoreductase subunit E [Planctomycetaceae bacterium]|nr:NAD(P)H-dependent oxidoreductase subunit E [Planctomycetaceae bacterium]